MVTVKFIIYILLLLYFSNYIKLFHFLFCSFSKSCFKHQFNLETKKKNIFNILFIYVNYFKKMAARQSAAPTGRKSAMNRKQSVNQPGGKAHKSDEKFPPPDIESLQLDDEFLFRSALQNDYPTICGAFDAKEHPLALYLIENSLFNKRNEFGKTVFDLAAKLGHRDFIRTILDRTNDKIDELAFNLRIQLKQKSAPYNFMHYACIWNRLDLVKYLAEHPKLIIDPNLDSAAEMTALTMSTSGAGGGANKNQQQLLAANPYAKTLGSILLRSRTKTGERPLDLAKRYKYNDLAVYLDYAGK